MKNFNSSHIQNILIAGSYYWCNTTLLHVCFFVLEQLSWNNNNNKNNIFQNRKRKKNTWNQVNVFKFLHPLNFEILICNLILKCHQIAWNVNFVFLFLFDSAKSPKKEQSGESNWGCRVFLSDVQDLLMLQPQTG